jgi:hypothetical protein
VETSLKQPSLPDHVACSERKRTNPKVTLIGKRCSVSASQHPPAEAEEPEPLMLLLHALTTRHGTFRYPVETIALQAKSRRTSGTSHVPIQLFVELSEYHQLQNITLQGAACCGRAPSIEVFPSKEVSCMASTNESPILLLYYGLVKVAAGAYSLRLEIAP